MLNNSDDGKIFGLSDIKKMKDLSGLKFDDNRFVHGIYDTINNLVIILHNFHHILDFHLK